MKPTGLNPYVGELGWCHECETFQRGDDARWRYMRWGQMYAWACAVCNEPWEFGIFGVVGCPEHRPALEVACSARAAGYPDKAADGCMVAPL